MFFASAPFADVPEAVMLGKLGRVSRVRLHVAIYISLYFVLFLCVVFVLLWVFLLFFLLNSIMIFSD